MKKYDMSKVMKTAWEIKYNNDSLSFSACLKKAWQVIKDAVANVFYNGMTVIVDGYERILSRWTKNGMDRVYINGGSRRGDGYVDLNRRKAVLNGNLAYQAKIADQVLAMQF